MPNDYLHTTWSRAKRLKMVGPSYEGEDIVCSIWRHIAGFVPGKELASFAEHHGIHFNLVAEISFHSRLSTMAHVHCLKAEWLSKHC